MREMRGKLAIGITANFVNRRTVEETQVPEISGVARIYNQSFFQSLLKATGQPALTGFPPYMPDCGLTPASPSQPCPQSKESPTFPSLWSWQPRSCAPGDSAGTAPLGHLA